jgi:Ca2+-binding RTX toxin-like protein
MRRTATILATMALMVVFSSGVALAAFEYSITGTDKTDILSGTRLAEQISGLGGPDQINGGGGADLVQGGQGADELGDGLGKDTVYGSSGADNMIGQGGDPAVDQFKGGTGNDTVQSRDIPAVGDVVACGPGTDTVYADEADTVKEDCERVKTP